MKKRKVKELPVTTKRLWRTAVLSSTKMWQRSNRKPLSRRQMLTHHRKNRLERLHSQHPSLTHLLSQKTRIRPRPGLMQTMQTSQTIRLLLRNQPTKIEQREHRVKTNAHPAMYVVTNSATESPLWPAKSLFLPPRHLHSHHQQHRILISNNRRRNVIQAPAFIPKSVPRS